jgi:5'-deoxynucleotidase YfbR-like HD superfamily hydrolase
MNLLEAAYLVKQTDVKRWGIVHTAREQSVAEHSYRVWVLSVALYDYLVPVPHNSNDREAVAYWALTHDADEIWTGDLPSTIKKPIEEVAPGALKKLKEKVLLDHVPAHAARARGIEGSFPAAVVKLAECVEAYSYYLRYSYNSPDRSAILNFLTENLEKAAEVIAKAEGGRYFTDKEHLWQWINEAKARV